MKRASKNSRSKRALMAASVAGLMAVAWSGLAGTTYAASEGEAHCYGVNKCKGTGECGGKGHSCAGKNGCKGKGFISLPKDKCLNIQGGRLTPEDK